jgi:hypothetical protein
MNRNAKKIQSKSRTHKVSRTSAIRFDVTSGETGNKYAVTLLGNGGARCNCDWAKYRPATNNGRCGCSHVVSVFDFVAKESGANSVSAWTNSDEAKRQHRPVVNIGDGLVLTTRSS